MLIKSIIGEKREELIRLSERMFRNERLRKKLIVDLYNINVFLRNWTFEKAQKDDLFKPESMIRKRKFYCREAYKGNFYYGIADALKKYSGYEGNIKACIEHGVYFGSYVNEKEAVKSGFPAVITFGEQRKKHLLKVSKK